jgi:hypothetical protein
MPSIEPCLRGSETDLPAVERAVLHALQLAEFHFGTWRAAWIVCEIQMRRSFASLRMTMWI